jgi:hypothetical protein
MPFSTRIRGLAAAVFLFTPLCLLAKTGDPVAPPPSILPSDFAGWHMAAPANAATEPQAADPSNVDALKEYGFTQFEQGNYTRDVSKLKVRAIRFVDATGAYGAYTFYRRSGLPKEDIGQGGASDNNRVLFWTGNTVVDASFDHVTGMSGAELRELAKDLPSPSGPAKVPPPLPGYLPLDALQPQTTHYALGDAGYTRSGGVLPPALVDFSRGAEALTAQYQERNGDGTLTLLIYPTPQLAADRERAIEAFFSAGNTPQAAWPQTLAESSSAALSVRRSGPIVVVTSGAFSAADAHKLASQVNYMAEVTWNRPEGYISEAAKAGRLLMGIATLVCILCGGTLLLGIFLGGARVLYRRMRGKPATSMEEMEFISLNLRNY